jgi:Hint domain
MSLMARKSGDRLSPISPARRHLMGIIAAGTGRLSTIAISSSLLAVFKVKNANALPAKHLVNGRSIAFDDDAEMSETIEYFRVELDTHEVIFAEGTAAESFQYKGGQIAWDNLGDYQDLYGGRAEVRGVRDPIQIAYDRIAARGNGDSCLNGPTALFMDDWPCLEGPCSPSAIFCMALDQTGPSDVKTQSQLRPESLKQQHTSDFCYWHETDQTGRSDDVRCSG